MKYKMSSDNWQPFRLNLDVLTISRCWLKSRGPTATFLERERETERLSLSAFLGTSGPYSPYQPCNRNLYIGIIIFPHIDHPQSTGDD